MTHVPVITVDGGSATGKGTVSKQLAKQFGFRLLESGALYRLLAIKAEALQIPLEEEETLAQLSTTLNINFDYQNNEYNSVFMDDHRVDPVLLYSEAVAKNASFISAFPRVRKALVERQRAFCLPPGLVAEGRDMGTVIFPDAEVKFFLTASLETRAKRRFNQLKERGVHANLDRLMLELKERDLRDEARAASPLKPAAHAIIIHTDHLTVGLVVARMADEIQRKLSITSI